MIEEKKHLKERKCPGCKKMVKPNLIPNTLQGTPFHGFGKIDLSGNPMKKSLIQCPKCGYLMGSK